jgi:DNA (cytosine-5)-methyltransferase 1
VTRSEVRVTSSLRVAELFAGVGGFRLGLEAAGWEVAWSNQWEPSTNTQHASECYEKRFGPDGHVNEDISVVLDQAESGPLDIPDVDLVCGGFPCQDYSVAKTLNQATGIRGKKGVLWWEIERFLKLKKPTFVFLENVDRLLKSPASQRGRDFAVMLACLNDLGYLVEWRVVNAADYGFPQKRRRVFIVGRMLDAATEQIDPSRWISRDGTLAKALPISHAKSAQTGLLQLEPGAVNELALVDDLSDLSAVFGRGLSSTPFANAGVAYAHHVWTRKVTPRFAGKRRTLRSVLLPDADVPEGFFVDEHELERWAYLKGAKNELRQRPDGGTYYYNEGAIPFPDPIDEPSRTILTGEGGRTPSRFKHIIQTDGGRFRRLTPIELERLNGFPEGHTDTGMPDGRRAFMMGNALVVGLVERIGRVLADNAGSVSIEQAAIAQP